VRTIDKLAERTATDADKLADAITVLEAGSELDEQQAALLLEVVGKLRKQPEPEAKIPASILAKQFDLQSKIA
jgi:hypothetical protein